jgi:MFS family permease
MMAIFRNRNFSLIWFAGLISIMGNWIIMVALPYHIYNVTGSALATSAWLMAYILPGVLFSSVAGVFVDRWDRKKTMIFTNFLQMLVILMLVLVKSPEHIWIVYVVGFLESTLSQFFSPAESALLPQLVDEEQLMQANSMNALNDNLGRVIGPVIGGVLLGVWGLNSIIIADAFSYLLSAILIGFIVAPGLIEKVKDSPTVESAREKFMSVWVEWRAGLKVIFEDKILQNIFVISGIALFADGIMSALLVVFMQNDVGANATEFGWMMTARGVGGVIGGLLLGQLGSKLSNRQLISWGLVLMGALITVILMNPSVLLIVILAGLTGIPAIAWIAGLQTQLQQSTTDEYRGRIFGTFGTTISLLMLASSGLAGLTADIFSAKILIFVAALISIGAGFLAAFILQNSKEQVGRQTDQPGLPA